MDAVRRRAKQVRTPARRYLVQRMIGSNVVLTTEYGQTVATQVGTQRYDVRAV